MTDIRNLSAKQLLELLLEAGNADETTAAFLRQRVDQAHGHVPALNSRAILERLLAGSGTIKVDTDDRAAHGEWVGDPR